jgi:tripartite-type tricarboxylate transporter receptor subunit TctC
MRWPWRAVLIALAFGAADASAQSYPSKPVRIVVPFAAGGAVDALARVISAKLQDSLGQPVIVENRAGAGGVTGADFVAKSPPDGYTILQNTNGQAISPAIYRALPFDTLKDFIPVTQLVTTSTVLVANPKVPAKTVKELIALAKANPGKLNYGMTGAGNSLHLTMEMLKRAAAIDIQAIPYRGDALLNPALMRARSTSRSCRSAPSCHSSKAASCARSRSSVPSARRSCRMFRLSRRMPSRDSRLPAGRAISCTPARRARS